MGEEGLSKESGTDGNLQVPKTDSQLVEDVDKPKAIAKAEKGFRDLAVAERKLADDREAQGDSEAAAYWRKNAEETDSVFDRTGK
jgi:hypothetical protein